MTDALISFLIAVSVMLLAIVIAAVVMVLVLALWPPVNQDDRT